MLDLLVTNATLPDGRTGMAVAVQGGRITEVAGGLQAPAHETVDAGGYLLSPPFCDPHFHMDATLSYGLPRVNESGTLLEAGSEAARGALHRPAARGLSAGRRAAFQGRR
ncbi:MAG: codA [Ramlibacter sp.]|nr:codA [Ramlibacter sp.]